MNNSNLLDAANFAFVLTSALVLGLTALIIYLSKKESTEIRGRIAQANLDAAAANRDAQQARLETSEVRREAEQLRKDAEDARLATARIQERLAFRELSPTQRSTIVDSLKRSGPHAIVVLSFFSDVEAYRYAKQFSGVLRAGGWTLRDESASPWGHDDRGLMIAASSEELLRSATVRDLVNALMQAGLKPVLRVYPQVAPNDQIALFVLSKAID